MVQVEVSVDSGEAFDRALARFKKMCGKKKKKKLVSSQK